MQLSTVVGDVSFSIPKCGGGGGGGFRGPELRHFNSHNHSLSEQACFKSCASFYIPKLGSAFHKHQARDVTVRASGNPSGDLAPVSPLEFETPVGQVLAQILQTHPYLLPATVDQELDKLEADRETQKIEAVNKSQDLLYKRIAEVKEKERRVTLEEILYCLVVWRFVENNITLIPKISKTSDPIGRVDFWPNQEHKLERIHSTEAFEMIQSHISLVLGERTVGPLETTVQISKIKLGKLYAASIMYGYFLKRVDERFQLEQSMKTIPESFGRDRDSFQDPSPANRLWDPESLIRIPADEEDDYSYSDDLEGMSQRLRSYVMYLDAETLQRYATIRSKEAISLVEKQTQALFGRPDIKVAEDGSIDTSNDELISLTFSGLTMLVLEAVGFGSFLWDSETYVESKYHFVQS